MSRRPSGYAVNHYYTPHRAYGAADWRRYHPHWNGHYFYHGGHYYYDSAFVYPAVVDNDWFAIATIAGGVALAGALDNDPYLFFGGTLGALYSYTRYEDDLHSHYGRYRLRAAYFGRPYFWRRGVRYDRVTLYRGGHKYFRFRRH